MFKIKGLGGCILQEKSFWHLMHFSDILSLNVTFIEKTVVIY